VGLLDGLGFFRVVDAAAEIAAAHGATIPQVALAWLLGTDGVTAPVIGAHGARAGRDRHDAATPATVG
jgi:aryl-alcohol dehydrogenase-like predicted oxidoreductase